MGNLMVVGIVSSPLDFIMPIGTYLNFIFSGHNTSNQVLFMRNVVKSVIAKLEMETADTAAGWEY